MLGISTRRSRRNVSKPYFQWFTIDNAIRLDGSAIKIKALFGVCLECLLPIYYSDMQKMQESQLYIFDPKAMHQIVVKVRFISPYFLSTPFSTNIPGSIYLRRDYHVHWVPGIFTFVNPRTLKLDFQRKQAHFWPWTSWNTWWVHFSPRIKGISTSIVSQGSSIASKGKCWTQCSQLRTCAIWVSYGYYSGAHELNVAVVPTFYRVSYKVPLPLKL